MNTTLQTRVHLWRQVNFPDADADQQLMGVFEEAGELAHANLKRKQKIRDSSPAVEKAHLQAAEEKEQDAVADIVIYLMGYCSYNGWDLNYIVNRTVQVVTNRNWIKYPYDGISK